MVFSQQEKTAKDGYAWQFRKVLNLWNIGAICPPYQDSKDSTKQRESREDMHIWQTVTGGWGHPKHRGCKRLINSIPSHDRDDRGHLVVSGKVPRL